MATVAAPRPAPRAPAGAADRMFYSGMAIAMALTVFVGFAPSYYLRGVFGAASPSGATELSPLLHLHGALFTGWVVLFLVQTALVATHRVRVHRRLGAAGVALAALMIVVGVATALDGARRGAAPPGAEPLAFLIVPLGDMVLFAGFVTAAVWLRRHSEAHKRLMLLAYVSLLAAAVARWPGMLALGPLAFFGMTLLFVGAGMLYDARSRGRVHPAYLWGGAILALSVPVRLVLSTTDAWRGVAEFLVR